MGKAPGKKHAGPAKMSSKSPRRKNGTSGATTTKQSAEAPRLKFLRKKKAAEELKDEDQAFASQASNSKGPAGPVVQKESRIVPSCNPFSPKESRIIPAGNPFAALARPKKPKAVEVAK